MDVTKSTVALAWSRPKDDGGSAITGYFVEYKVVSAETWSRQETKVTSTMFTVPGLTPDTDYQFRIVAVNDIGESEAGPVSDLVTCKDPFGESAKKMSFLMSHVTIILAVECDKFDSDYNMRPVTCLFPPFQTSPANQVRLTQ